MDTTVSRYCATVSSNSQAIESLTKQYREISRATVDQKAKKKQLEIKLAAHRCGQNLLLSSVKKFMVEQKIGSTFVDKAMQTELQREEDA